MWKLLSYTFNVKITNTGSVAGKGVAQIYVNAPYIKGEVEKSHVVLGGFAKSKLLQPGKSDVVTIEIKDDYFSSYDYKNEKCYIMDAGNYNFYLSSNAHSWETIDKESASEQAKHLWTRNLSKKIVYKDGKDGKRTTDLVAATNKEDEELNHKFKSYKDGTSGDGYIHDFSREDFKTSFPTAPKNDDYVLTNEYALEQVAQYDVWDEKNNPITEMPVTDDHTNPMVAATFNLEVASLLGEVFGEEAFCNKLAGGSLITGIYGYGLNVHRSAFGGRNYEYYSEDGLLSGKMAAAEASKASEKGLITFMKHYVLNDQETNRQKNGYCSWVNEQAFREIYTKGWEIYIKEAKMTINYYKVNEEGKYELASKEMPAATGIMTSYNRVGGRWAGASDSINDILRDEFGYTGTTITDAGGQPNTYMTTDLMLRKGGALTLTNNGTNGLYDTNSATAVYWLKDATKHILYNKANSNCIVGLAPGSAIKYTTAPWRIWRGVAWGVTGVLVALDAVYVTLIALDKIKVKEKQKVARDDDSDEF